MQKVALVVAAHPDDPEFGMGGTTALWVSQGWRFHYLIVTDGSKGSADGDRDQMELMRTRQGEQRKAAQLLGVESVTFLGFPDGEVALDRRLLGKIVEHIRHLQPHAVFSHSPESFEYRRPGTPARIAHRDHRVVGQAVLDAVYPAARDPHNFPEHRKAGLQPHNVAEVYLWGHPQAQERIDIQTTWERKLKSILAHESQVPPERRDEQLFLQRWREESGIFEYFFHISVPS